MAWLLLCWSNRGITSGIRDSCGDVKKSSRSKYFATRIKHTKLQGNQGTDFHHFVQYCIRSWSHGNLKRVVDREKEIRLWFLDQKTFPRWVIKDKKGKRALTAECLTEQKKMKMSALDQRKDMFEVEMKVGKTFLIRKRAMEKSTGKPRCRWWLTSDDKPDQTN